MRKYNDESEIFYSIKNVKLRKNFLKYVLTDFDNFNESNVNELINWLLSGKFGYDPYIEFYEEYLILKDDLFIEEKINLISDSLKTTKSLSKSCQICNIPEFKVHIWRELGKHYEKPFDSIYNRYKLFKNKLTEEKINVFLNIFNGFNEVEACDKSDISQVQLESWLRLNKLGGIFKDLHDRYLEILKKNNFKEYLVFDDDLNISKNVMDMFLVMSDDEKYDYNDFHNDFNLIYSNHNKFNINYPESYIEQFLDSFHNKNKFSSIKLLNIQAVNTCDLLFLVDSKKEKEEFYRNHNIDKFLINVSLGYDDYKSAKLANVNYRSIDNWLNNGISELSYDTFFEDYNSALILNGYLEFINDNLDKFIDLFNDGKSITEICSLLYVSLDDIELYLNLGYLNYRPYDVFYREISFKSRNQFYDEHNLNVFLNEIQKGKFKLQAARKSKIKKSVIDEYFKKGNEGIEFYSSFLTDYKIALIKNYYNNNKAASIFIEEVANGKSDNDASQSSKIPVDVIKFWLSLNVLRNFRMDYADAITSIYYSDVHIQNRKLFLDLINQGFSKSDVLNENNLPSDEINTWLNLGAEGKEPFKEFYEEYMKTVKKELSNVQAINENELSSKEINGCLDSGDDGRKSYDEVNDSFIDVSLENLYEQTKLDVFLDEIKAGSLKTDALNKIEMSEEEFHRHFLRGKSRDGPYKVFYNEYFDFLVNLFNSETDSKRKKFLYEFAKGLTFEESLYYSGLSKDYVERCFSFRDDAYYFDRFYKKYLKAESDGLFYRAKIEKNLFLELIAKGRTTEEACIESNLNENKANGWITKGKSSKNQFTEFYENYLTSFIHYFNSNEASVCQGEFLNFIQEGNDKKEACEKSDLNIKNVDKWISYGKQGIEPFTDFKNKYEDALLNYFYSDEITVKLKEFLKFVEDGETRADAYKKANLNSKLVNSWIRKGKKDEEPYSKFYNKYNKSLIIQFNNYESEREDFLNLIANGETNKNACEILGLKSKMINDWIRKGRNGENLYVEFYEKYDEIRHSK